ncbi:centromere protein N isoform X2 [Phyllopteryx taeniolatus]|uniref:centromere protein N isoform X2 n=1 Tax=Phyllopteryx taeniolatus TaxID=161469 RepID=UPI002AD2D5EB|nr:centromere protein N isoform X2 [Phyllopteryx taeniolatus]
MEDQMRCLLRRLVRRIPTQVLKVMLKKWGRLTAAQQQNIDLTPTKWALADQLLALSEENGWTVRHVAELEMIYVMDKPNQGMWHALQLVEPESDAQAVDLMQFKEQFKSHLKEVARHVSVKMKKNTDEAVWIRIAWGDSYSRPNNMKATYAVHYLQTPYVFVTRLASKQKRLLSQALIIATRHEAIKDANLSGQNLSAIRDLLMQQYEQLETNFKDPINQRMTEREEPFKCVVTFKSSNLLESLRHCAASGIASTPLTPLLSSIPRKGRNFFLITDNVQRSASQINQQTN